MKGIATCQDCRFNITIYRFTGNQGFFNVPKKWCEECDLLIDMVKKTISDLRLEDKTQLKIKPWFLWWWQPFFTNLGWHAPILVINGQLISQGTLPKKEALVKALTSENVSQMTDFE